MKAPLLPQAGREQGYRDQALQEILAALRDSPLAEARLITGIPDANGVLTQGIAFTAGQTRVIDHGLGRTITGWLEVGMPSFNGNRPALRPAHDATAVDLGRQVSVAAVATGSCLLLVW